MTDYRKLFKAAFERRDAPAVLDVIELGLREEGDDFVDWLCDDAVLALVGYLMCRDHDGCEPLDSFALPIAECLAQVIQHFP
jgi:hypothetical protein